MEPQHNRPFRTSRPYARWFVVSFAAIDDWLDNYEYGLEERVHIGQLQYWQMTDAERQAHDEEFLRWLNEEFS
jgi:hypothetical protein